jgi:hypothetical protein
MAGIQRTVHESVTVATDKEIHVSTLEKDGGHYTDIREYIPSLQQYGRGITFPARFGDPIYTGLGESING